MSEQTRPGTLTTIAGLFGVGAQLTGLWDFRNAQAAPAMVIAAPEWVRLVQYQEGGETRVEAYVQPTFVNVGINERVEVVRGMDLSVSPAEGGKPMEGAEDMEFGWRSHGDFSATSQDGSQVGCPSEVYSGGTSTLVAAPNKPLAPVVLFAPKDGPTGPYFEPDQEYLVTLNVKRAVNDIPREKVFVLHVRQQDIELMRECKSPVPVAAADPPS